MGSEILEKQVGIVAEGFQRRRVQTDYALYTHTHKSSSKKDSAGGNW
jgi:hypothetical protein